MAHFSGPAPPALEHKPPTVAIERRQSRSVYISGTRAHAGPGSRSRVIRVCRFCKRGLVCLALIGSLEDSVSRGVSWTPDAPELPARHRTAFAPACLHWLHRYMATLRCVQ